MAATASLAVRLQRERWKDPDDLAQELVAGLRSGIDLTDVNTDSLDGRYAVKSAANTFTASQTITANLTLSDAEVTEPGLSVTHSGSGTTNQSPTMYLSATGGSGAIWVERVVASPTDVLAKFKATGSNSNAYDGVSIEYQGLGAALGISHSGGSGGGPFYAIGTNRPISIGGAGASIIGHSLTVTGNLTATNFVGNLTGTATQATLATQANAVRTASANYVTPSQEQLLGVVRRIGSVPTGTVTWSQLTVQTINYLGW